jgi:hypothetical protein
VTVTGGILDGFAGGDVAAVIEIADRDALYAGNAERSFEMFASANAGADGGEADGVAGSDGTRRGGKDARLQDSLRDRRGRKSAGAEMHELTTGQGILGHELLRLLNFRAFGFQLRDCKASGEELLHRWEEISKSIF